MVGGVGPWMNDWSVGLISASDRGPHRAIMVVAVVVGRR